PHRRDRVPRLQGTPQAEPLRRDRPDRGAPEAARGGSYADRPRPGRRGREGARERGGDPRPRPRRDGARPVSDWSVRLPQFEGPLDLLLHLVRVNEVEITNLPIV